MTRAKGVVIVGAGIMGLCSADALLRRGHAVTVIEQSELVGEGCSWGNGGLIVPSHFVPLASPGMAFTGLKMLLDRQSPFGLARFPNIEMARWMSQFLAAGTSRHVERCAPVLRDLNLASRNLYETVYSGIDAGYQRLGELMICQTEHGFESERALSCRAKALGMGVTVLDRQEVSSFEPNVRIEAKGAVYFFDDAHLTPSIFMQSLMARVQAAGGQIRAATKVTGFEVDRERITALKTSAGSVEADEVVLAAGAFTGILGASLGLNALLMAGRGYGFTIKEGFRPPRYPAILTEGRVAVTPMLNGVRFVGTMELGPPGDAPVNRRRLAGMWRTIRSAYPDASEISEETVQVWSGLRPVTPDGMPLIGRFHPYENLLIASGHGMMGMSLGPITGEMIAQTICKEQVALSSPLLDPNRFQ